MTTYIKHKKLDIMNSYFDKEIMPLFIDAVLQYPNVRFKVGRLPGIYLTYLTYYNNVRGTLSIGTNQYEVTEFFELKNTIVAECKNGNIWNPFRIIEFVDEV